MILIYIIIDKGSGSLINNCLTCSGNTHPYFYSIDKKCFSTCPVKYYGTGNICKPVSILIFYV